MSGLEKVVEKVKKPLVYQFDFIKNQKTSSGVFVTKNALTSSPYFVEDFWFEIDQMAYPRQYYEMGDRVLVHTNVSKIADYKDNAIINVSLNNYAKTPQVIAIKDGGQDKVLIVGGGKAELIDERKVEFTYTIGTCLTYIHNRLFYADGRVIHFTEQFNYLDEIENTPPTQYFELDEDLGIVQAMYPIDNQLVVVCLHGIVNISFSSILSEFQIKRANIKEIDVAANSVVPLGNHLCFLSDKNFCIFDGSKVNYFPIFANKLEVVASGEHEGFYIVNYVEKATNKTMLIDIETKEKSYIPHHLGISKHGGYATSPKSKTSVFSRTITSDEKCSYDSVSLDFDTLKDKRLLEIECYSKGKATLTLSGDFGTKTFPLNGYHIFKCNEKSQKYSLSLALSQRQMPFQNLKLKYRIVGE